MLGAQLKEIGRVAYAHLESAFDPDTRVEARRAKIISEGLNSNDPERQYASLKHLRAAQAFFSVPLLGVEGIDVEPFKEKYPKLVSRIIDDNKQWKGEIPYFDLCLRPDSSPVHPLLSFVRPSEYDIEDVASYRQIRIDLPGNFDELPIEKQINEINVALDRTILEQPGVTSLRSACNSYEFAGWSFDITRRPAVLLWVHAWTQELRLTNAEKQI